MTPPAEDGIDFRRMRRIGILRALVLGDLLCATPAWRALRHAAPDAEIVLIGLPWARELSERLSTVDRFVEFPGWPGLPERALDMAAVPSFLGAMRGESFDLLLQMHGSGSIVNDIVARCEPKVAAGFHPAASADEPPGPCFAPWPETGHEIERMLRLTDHLGMPRRGTDLDFPLRAPDRAEVRTRWPSLFARSGYVCVHAGAQLPSRRWPAERFAAVADALADRGAAIVLTGTAGEAALVERVRSAMRHPALSAAGHTSLWTLGALIESAALLVSNDTGLSHVAAALGTPSVVVSAGSDVSRWAPLDAQRHRVLWSAAPCRPCNAPVCPYDHACATAISAEDVIVAALDRWTRTPAAAAEAAIA